VACLPEYGMNTRAIVARGHPVSDRWRSGLHEVSVGLAVFAVYLVCTHGLAEPRRIADGNGLRLLTFEQWAGIDVERPLNVLLRDHHTLGALIAWEYATTYVIGTFGVVGVLWWRRSPLYSWARNTLIFLTLIAIVCFVLWPTTPPRLLPGETYTDIVAIHHPPLTWGTSVVAAGGDQFAAMPSLHIGWVAWMCAVAIRSRSRTLVKLLCFLHLLLTSYVIVATATHYVVDIAGGLLLIPPALLLGRVSQTHVLLRVAQAAPRCVVLSRQPKEQAASFVRLARHHLDRRSRRTRSTRRALERFRVEHRARAERRPGGQMRSRHADESRPRRRPPKVAAEDVFFLYVESTEVPQQVGGVALLDVRAGSPSLDDVRALMAERLPRMPRLGQRISPHGSARRPRWVDDPEIDLSWHVRETTLPAPGGRLALEEFVGRQAAGTLDRDRPLWQMWLVRGVGPDEEALVVLLHHVIADGLGVIDILRNILEPQLPSATGDVPRGPGRVARAAAGTAGLIQLGLDGAAPTISITGPMRGDRVFRTIALPLDRMRDLAKASGVRVTDVLLAVVGDAVGEVLVRRGEKTEGKALRVAVPVSLRPPAPAGQGRSAVPGNRTAGLRLDVPVDPRPARDRLLAVHRAAERRRRSGREIASTGVIRAMGLLPPPVQARAARWTYRARFFGSIVSNMPGPSVRLSFAGAPLREVYPLLPLAAGVPLAVGALSWSGRLYVSLTAEPHLVPEAHDLGIRLGHAFERLESDVRSHRVERHRGNAVRDRRRLPAARRKPPVA
jgi:diacylglycerol O-acyltransferase